MGSLLGPSVKLVEKSTAHFSSVTDSVPFRSQRLIFFRSCRSGRGSRGEASQHPLQGQSLSLKTPPPPLFPMAPQSPHQVLEQGRTAVARNAVLQGHGVVDDFPSAFSARGGWTLSGCIPAGPGVGRSLSPGVDGKGDRPQISISLLGFSRRSLSWPNHNSPSRSSPDMSPPFLCRDHSGSTHLTALPPHHPALLGCQSPRLPWPPPAQQAFTSPGLRSSPRPLGHAQLPGLLLSHHVSPDQRRLGWGPQEP